MRRGGVSTTLAIWVSQCCDLKKERRWEGPLDALPRVLVVEDDYLALTFIEDALRDGGFEFDSTPSGEEAITLFQDGRHNYRALATDINVLGSMNGWEVARSVREISPEIPVLYMTAADAAEWPIKGVPKSILLCKPFAPAQLIAAVSQLLNACAPSAS
jgi:DNA-binding response OmpR family regulator